MDAYKRIVVDGARYYGKHLVLSATGCGEALLSKEAIREFLGTMVRAIDMTAFGPPIVERFGSGIEIGISAVQLIETSAIVMHTNDGARDLYLDVFSCKDFDERVSIDVVRSTFTPASIEFQTLLRK